MDKQKLKLVIIRRITSCEDVELLQTVYQLLNQLDTELNLSTPIKDPRLLAALLGEAQTSATTAQEEPTTQEEIEDLQRSIDDVFGL